jgi:hypothetical protein
LRQLLVDSQLRVMTAEADNLSRHKLHAVEALTAMTDVAANAGHPLTTAEFAERLLFYIAARARLARERADDAMARHRWPSRWPRSASLHCARQAAKKKVITMSPPPSLAPGWP